MIRVKPTAHKQYCFLCRKSIEKGTKQITLESGMWHGWLPRDKLQRKGYTREFHAVHLNVPDEMARSTMDYKSLYVLRHLYFHDHCFGCVLKLMADQSKVGFKIDVNCENCKQRFDCYTGNTGLHAVQQQQRNHNKYVPSAKYTREITNE